MAISRKEFEDGNFTILRGKAYEVLEFLKSNKDKAYLSKEIAEELKISIVGINPILKRLITESLVEKKDPYFSLSRADKKVLKEERKSKPESEPVEDEGEGVMGDDVPSDEAEEVEYDVPQ